MPLSLSPLSQQSARWVHPLAWWTWGLSAATLAILSENPIDHITIFIAVFLVLISMRSNGSWANSTSILFRLAMFIIGFRIFIEVIFGVHFGGTVLITLPQFQLPDLFGGLTIGGVVGLSGITSAFFNGFQLATVVVAASAAAVLVPPNLLLKSMPSAIYEAGLVTVIALGFLPALSSDAKRMKTATALRGRPIKGIWPHLKLLMPLIDSSLNRAVSLANAMESRGFGKTKKSRVNPAFIGLLLIAGLFILSISVFNILRSPINVTSALLFLLSLLIISIAVYQSGKLKIRSKYQSQSFGSPEYLIGAASISALMLSWFTAGSTKLTWLVLVLLLVPILVAPKVPTGFQS